MARVHHRHRDRILRIWGFCCGFCKRYHGYDPNVEIHHIVPQKKGGSSEEDNLIPLCLSCHTLVRKGVLKFDPKKLLAELKILLDKCR